MRLLIYFCLCFVLSSIAEAQSSSLPSNSVRTQFQNLTMAAIQDLDDLEVPSSELRWQLSRSEAHKSVTALIRAAQTELEIKISGAVWDMFVNEDTCRLEYAGGNSLDQCYATLTRLRTLALKEADIDPKRMYPHVPGS